MTNPNYPAFSPEFVGTDKGQAVGLSKREYFAGLAMQGLCSDRAIGIAVKKACDQEGLNVEIGIARMSLTLADALIAELNKT